ncbi:hypothetical protein KRMM14A1259_41130 [Krasilnikovia sp. MM14-A1259]
MILSEITQGGESPEVDGVHRGYVAQVKDETHRPHPADRVHEDLAKCYGAVEVHRAVRLHDETAIRARLNIDRSVFHRSAFRHRAFCRAASL